MSARAPAPSRLPWGSRARHRGASCGALAAAACALVLIGSAGCNGALTFNTPLPSGGMGGDGAGGEASADGRTGTGGETTPPDAGPDLPVDNGPLDTGVDVPARPDLAPDRPLDVTPDVREAGVDANGPVVCRTAADCRFPTLALHCLIAGGQTTGSCVECTGDSDCAMAGLRRCDTAAGSTTFHRCVECMDATVAADCPSLSSEHGSTCNNEHHCLQGCSDDSADESLCVKPGFVCQGSGGAEPNHQCADCLSQADCTAPLRCINFVCLQCTLNTDCGAGQFCDNVAGRCVACRDSNDCRVAGLRLCNPATHTCVASTN
ncbi:MAG TPA: hypothetical protein VFH68_26410 [Polyangia bacterium]|jgi:hypothetical protein|nr:hypothetical protein [Polyangia bacterium]